MSLHLQPTPEAQQRLLSQRRNSTISSLVIAALAVILAALVLGLFLLPSLDVEDPPIAISTGPESPPPPPPGPVVPLTHSQRNPSSPSPSEAHILLADAIAPVSVPMPDVVVTTPSMDFGVAEDFGTGQVSADWTGGDFSSIPPELQKRCSKQDRLARLQETGGTPQCEDAVIRALDHLKATQSADGSWTGSDQAAMTGLALLTYLGHCETPVSPDYGDTVLRAITWLVDLGAKSGGKLTTNAAQKHWPYEHAIATYALAEASTFCKEGGLEVPQLFEITRNAGRLIIENQHEKSGGWDYSYDTRSPRGGDLSITAWQLQALKACQHTGLEFKGLTRAANRALDYVNKLHCQDGGFGYAAPNETPHAASYRTMTGGGVLSLQMWDKGALSSARKGAKYLREHSKFDYHTEFSDLYGHYYEAQAMINRGGPEWAHYNAMFRDQLLQNQKTDGSWPAPGGGKPIRAVAPQYTANSHYRTCLNTLMLEVYYRFLPGTHSRTHSPM